MNLPYPFKSAHDVRPDLIGRIPLVDEGGKVLAHLPLTSAHDFAPKGLGSGHGFGDGFGDGFGYGYGYGYGDFDGAGSGGGYGYSFGDGAGSGTESP
jgi:hypothetical protein